MSKIKIQLYAQRGTVVFSVLNQDASLRSENPSGLSFVSSNGITIKSHMGPSIAHNTVYIRGFSKSLDNKVSQIFVGPQDAAENLVSRIKFAFFEFAQNNYFEGPSTPEGKQAYIARLDGQEMH